MDLCLEFQDETKLSAQCAGPKTTTDERCSHQLGMGSGGDRVATRYSVFLVFFLSYNLNMISWEWEGRWEQSSILITFTQLICIDVSQDSPPRLHVSHPGRFFGNAAAQACCSQFKGSQTFCWLETGRLPSLHNNASSAQPCWGQWEAQSVCRGVIWMPQSGRGMCAHVCPHTHTQSCVCLVLA